MSIRSNSPVPYLYNASPYLLQAHPKEYYSFQNSCIILAIHDHYTSNNDSTNNRKHNGEEEAYGRQKEYSLSMQLYNHVHKP